MKNKLLIAVDLGGTNLRIALLDQTYAILHKVSLQTKKIHSQPALLETIVLTIRDLLARHSLAVKNIYGIGIGVPGPVDHTRGLVYFLPNIPGWKNVALKSRLQKIIGVPVFVDNDAKLMTLAEHVRGSARGFANVLCITLGTGVGGGIILNGNLYRGTDNASGEIGHLPINISGPRCNCGGSGCLEAYIGNKSIMQQAKKMLGRAVTLEDLSAMAKRGDRRAIRIWRQAGARLGVALTAAVNLLNIDAVVIGGGVSKAGSILFKSVRDTVRQRAMSVQGKRVKIIPARLGIDAGLIGAAVMAGQRL